MIVAVLFLLICICLFLPFFYFMLGTDIMDALSQLIQLFYLFKDKEFVYCSTCQKKQKMHYLFEKKKKFDNATSK
jgi:predicted PurR-regulated permease PerM